MLHAGLVAVFLIETLLSAFLVFVFMGATSRRAPAGFAPIAIGLTLTAMHIMAIPVSNASVNPARSLGSAVFAGGAALSQLWVFWVAPLLGGFLGGSIARWLQEEPGARPSPPQAQAGARQRGTSRQRDASPQRGA
jgi:aquaporin Z